MQNEPNYRKTKLIHKHRFNKDLRKIFTHFGHQKTNPKRTQFLQSQKMNTRLVFTRNYENLPPLDTKKTNPIDYR
jgi:hypothetical protein